MRSGGASNATSELKSLLELASDPKKLKQAIEDLEEKTDAANEAVKKLSEKQALFNQTEKAQAEKEQQLAELMQALDKKERELTALGHSLGHREAALPALEAALVKKQHEFEEDVVSKTSQINAKEKAADKRLSEALELKAQAESVLKEYEAKASKLKAAMGV